MYAKDCVKACTVCTHNMCMHTNAQVRPLIWFVFIFCFYYKSPPLCSQECIRALGRKGAHLPFRGSVLTQVHTYVHTYEHTCTHATIEIHVSWCRGESWVDQRILWAYIHDVALLYVIVVSCLGVLEQP